MAATNLNDQWRDAMAEAVESMLPPQEWKTVVTLREICEVTGRSNGGGLTKKLTALVDGGKVRAKHCVGRDGGKLMMRYCGEDVVKAVKDGGLL